MGTKPPHISDRELRTLLNDAEHEPVESLNWDELKQPFKK